MALAFESGHHGVLERSNEGRMMPTTRPRPIADVEALGELRRTRALLDLERAALEGRSIEELLDRTVDAVSDCLGTDRFGVFEWSRIDVPELRLRAGTGWPDGHIGERTVTLEVPAPSGEMRVEIGGVPPYGMLVAVPTSGSFSHHDAEFLAGVAGMLVAAIERRSTEDALRSSEQRLLMAQQIAHMGSYDWDITRDVNLWSDELYRIYGTEPQSFNASYERFLSFIHPDDREKIQAIHQRAYADGQPYEMEERIIRPDGELRILASNGQVLTDDGGRPVRMVGICFDVTEERLALEKAEAFDRSVRDEAIKRRAALEINDNVVQGLAAVVYALEGDLTPVALEVARKTLDAAQAMMSDLLEHSSGDALGPGGLVRAAPAQSHLGGDWDQHVDASH